MSAMTPKQVVCALGAHTGPVMSEAPPAAVFALCLHRVDQIRHGRGRNLFLKKRKEKKRKKCRALRWSNWENRHSD